MISFKRPEKLKIPCHKIDSVLFVDYLPRSLQIHKHRILHLARLCKPLFCEHFQVHVTYLQLDEGNAESDLQLTPGCLIDEQVRKGSHHQAVRDFLSLDHLVDIFFFIQLHLDGLCGVQPLV